MANRTVKFHTQIHGTNPQFLIEKIVRERIYDSKYWQEECFRLTSAQVLERAVDDLKYVGSYYGNKIDCTPFLCLVLKLLQIQPQKEIIYLYIDQPDFKYLRALGAFYLRLTGRPVEIYTKLEPLYSDYRKLRVMDGNRTFSVIHMDEFIDNLLRDVKVLNVTIPRISKRIFLEENREIEPYKSELEELDLIPNQLIEESVQREKDAHTRRPYRARHEPAFDNERYDRSSSSSSRRSHHDRHRHSSRDDHHRNRRDDDRLHRDSDRYRDRHHYHEKRRSRSTSPRHHGREGSMVKSSGGHSRFSQEEIDKMNAIRRQVGLKPLR